MSAIWSPSRRKLIWQPPVPRPLAKWLRAHEVAGIYQTVPGGRWDAKRGKLQAVTTVARTAGLCPSANSYNVTVAVPGQDLGAVWFAQIALDNTSYSALLAALYSAENYGNSHAARIGWDDYSTNVLNFYFKYSSYSAVSQNVTLAAGKRVAGIAMYVDAAEVTCYVDGVEVATAAQAATLAATHYAFTGTSTSGQHVSSYGEAYQSKGTTCAGSLFGPKALARELSRNPWMAFAPRDRGVVMVSAAGGATALSASGAAQASGSADLAAGIALAGVGVAVAGGSAAAAVAIPLSAAGIATAAGSATGAIAVTLSASGLATAAGQAGLDVAAALAAAGSAQASGTATLSGGAEGEISASGAAQAGGAAVLSILVTLAAAGTAQAGGSATLSGGPEGALSASGAAQAGGSATATVAIALTAAGLAQAIGSGQLTLSIPLSAIGFATSGGTATLIDINLVRVLAAPRAARPPRVQSGRRAPNLSASRRSWR